MIEEEEQTIFLMDFKLNSSHELTDYRKKKIDYLVKLNLFSENDFFKLGPQEQSHFLLKYPSFFDGSFSSDFLLRTSISFFKTFSEPIPPQSIDYFGTGVFLDYSFFQQYLSKPFSLYISNHQFSYCCYFFDFLFSPINYLNNGFKINSKGIFLPTKSPNFSFKISYHQLNPSLEKGCMFAIINFFYFFIMLIKKSLISESNQKKYFDLLLFLINQISSFPVKLSIDEKDYIDNLIILLHEKGKDK